MSEQDPNIIQPTAAPLSHLAKPRRQRRQPKDWRIWGVGAAVVGVVIFALSWLPETPAPANPVSKQGGQPADGETITPAPAAQAPQTPSGETLAPFAQTQHQRAREKAQQALAGFVEQQIRLEEDMRVDQWGQEQLDAAMALAQEGDSEFAEEQYEAALNLYQSATQHLSDLIDAGNQLFDQHLAQTTRYIDELNIPGATTEIERALAIKANDTQALALKQRVSVLPQIVSLLRTAKNHELGERPQQALAVYQQIEQLDPATRGLAALRQNAARAESKNQVAQHLSRGFAHLNQRRFDAARKAFNAALLLEPDNDIAKGGLAQLAKENDLAVIKQHQQVAERALAAEEWQQAIEAYEAVLKMDNNIQFASNGLSSAKAHLRSSTLLNKIASEPQKLSRQQLYLEAVDILENARTLEHRGPKMRAVIATVDNLIVLYRDPVDVVLVSDNATEIIMSNVGQLGRFERKTLSLRPGQYTIRGSQDGCRDIYLSIEVLPGIRPVDLSCPESL